MLNWLLTHTPLFYLTQSLWRDEAFSVLTAEKPILSFIGTLNFEPPFYYVLLHFWMKLFGESEIAIRSLSFIGFSLATCIIIIWAEKQFESHWLSWMTPIFFFFNPMLLYYAFEVRAYGWLIFFSTLSMYAYTQKKYRLLAIANILGFYTHSYGILLPFVEAIHFFLTFPEKRQILSWHRLVRIKPILSFFFTGIAIAPWFIPIYEEAKKMRPTWYYPVDVQLIKSVLGNMFIGYDGTPGGYWGHTAILSAILLGFFYFSSRYKKQKKEISFLLLLVFLPLFVIIGISFKKPLFVNRYLIFVTIAEILLMSYAIIKIQNKWLQKIIATAIIIFLIIVNVTLPNKKAKGNIRRTIQEANTLRGDHDVLYITDPLIFFESVYYTPDREHVFLYNPQHNPFPWYVGEAAFSAKQMRDELPEYPIRAFIVASDHSITVAYRTNAVPTPKSVSSP